MHEDHRSSRDSRTRGNQSKRRKRSDPTTEPIISLRSIDDSPLENCCNIVMFKKKRHAFRGTVVPALILLIGSCALQSRAAAFPDWTDCPAVCRCKWTSGKKSALCPDAGLTSLPGTLDPDMQVLDLSGNRIPGLTVEIFKRAGLVNLQRVFVRNAGITKIHVDAFRDMGILVEIDLSDNLVSNLEPGTFHGNDRLRVLILNGNPLGALRSHQFPMLQHLRNLELQRCEITEINDRAFTRLTGLESLKLDHNLLKHLDVKVIANLDRLTTLTLDGNKWQCDCRLREFRRWMIDVGAPKKLYGTSQNCWSPLRLRSQNWENVDIEEFACEPEVFVMANTLREEVTGNLSLACLATGDPEPEVRWRFNGVDINLTRIEQTISGSYASTSDIYAEYRDSGNSILERWNNLTILNATEIDAGEYSCNAKNIAGTAKDSVNIVVPRAISSPTFSQTNNFLLWLGLAGGGTAAICASASVVVLVFCFCGTSRRNRKREKVKFSGSASFGDQEKKLLDLSVTTTTAGSNSVNDRASGHGSIPDTCSPGDLELAEREIYDGSTGSASVTVELATSDSNVIDDNRRFHGFHDVYPPPPPEFTTGILPAGIFGNIFISVAVPHDSERCYPDLLDIPVHGNGGGVEKFYDDSRVSSSVVSSYATLPRRSLRSHDLGSPYDNMGPRVTATGSSTFSLTDDPRLSPTPPNRIIEPPIEFVSL